MSISNFINTEGSLINSSLSSANSEEAKRRFALLEHIVMKAAVDIALKQYFEIEERKKNAQYGPQTT